MADKGKVACVLAEGFEDSEFKKPYDRLKAEGWTVEIVGTERGKELKGKKGEVTAKADKGIGEVKPGDYKALLIPGGHSPDALRADSRFVDFVKAFDDAKKPIAAICHGPQLLMSAKIIDGRTLTAWKTIQQDLGYTKAKVKDEPVVMDGNWVTSRKPDDIPQFNDAMVRLFA